HAAQRMQFIDRVEERLKQIPGMHRVAIADSVPPGGLEHDRILGVIAVEGRARREGGPGGNVVWRSVTPDYFSALGVRITRGSGFTEEERNSNDHFVVLSEAAPARLFPGDDPSGQHLELFERPANHERYTVVGV